MNKRQVIILWAIAIALGITISIVKLGQGKAADSTTERSPGEKLLTSFPAEEVSRIEIDGADKDTTLVKSGGTWKIEQRENFPANLNLVHEFLRNLGDLKITQAIEAGPSFAPRFGMDETSSDPQQHGLIITFKNAEGKELEKLNLGKDVGGDPQMAAGGRYIRDASDSSGFYATSELFAAVSSDPQNWLSSDFIKVEKIKSIAITEPDSETTAWKIIRSDEDSNYLLADSAPGLGLDPENLASLKSLFSYLRFEDVIPADQVEQRAAGDQKQTLTIETLEGITYTMAIQPTKPAEAPASLDPMNPSPQPEETYLMTIKVSSNFPTERKKEEGETEDQAKEKDAAFASRLKALQSEVATAESFSGRVFEISKYMLDPVLKSRTEMLSKPDQKPAAGPEPKRGMSAVTPPISIPPMNPTERPAPTTPQPSVEQPNLPTKSPEPQENPEQPEESEPTPAPETQPGE